MKARKESFSDKYFEHVLALGLATSVTLVVLAAYFIKPLTSQTVTTAVREVPASNAQQMQPAYTPSPTPSSNPYHKGEMNKMNNKYKY